MCAWVNSPRMANRGTGWPSHTCHRCSPERGCCCVDAGLRFPQSGFFATRRSLLVEALRDIGHYDSKPLTAVLIAQTPQGLSYPHHPPLPYRGGVKGQLENHPLRLQAPAA